MSTRLLATWSIVCAAATISCDVDDARSADAAASSALLPCDVADVLERRCARCHGRPLAEGAPMALLAPADFARSRGNRKTSDAVLERIVSSDRPMPPAPAAPLPEAEVEALRGFIAAGARPDPSGCSVELAAVDPDAGDAAPGGTAPATAGDWDWSMFGGDLEHSRSNPEQIGITQGNVASLRRAFHVETGPVSATPAIVDGIVYVPTWSGVLHALSIADGSTVFRTELPTGVDSSPAVSDELIFVSDVAGEVHALERDGGALRWSQSLDPHPDAHLWSSPIPIPEENLVVVGVASHEEVVVKPELTFTGSVVALDAGTGQERWRFSTVSDDEQGVGVAVWASAAVDTARGYLYIGTGNNYTPPGGALADSLLAIDYAQGALVWSRQFLPEGFEEDVFSLAFVQSPDYDIGSTASLFTAGGRDLVGIGIKSGLYVALDRDSGDPAWTQQASPGGIFGGIIAAPAYADGAIFVAGNDPDADETVLSALDAQTGEAIWSERLPGHCFGGVAHGAGLVYAATMSGRIAAFAERDGEPLWSEDLPGTATGPALAAGTLVVGYGFPLALNVGDAEGSGGIIGYRPAASAP